MAESQSSIKLKKKKWENDTLKPALARFNLKSSPNRFYTPLDLGKFDFAEKVGFPGEYPFTAGAYPVFPFKSGERGAGHIAQAPGMARAGRYSGYGSSEDTRDYYLEMQKLGRSAGPNLAFDLPTQIGLDSDSPFAEGEVGRVGVAIDTLKDMETIYEAFRGDRDLDKIGSAWTINAPTNFIVALYVVLAQKRGIPVESLRFTPQNDILKEFLARGTYIFPPRPSMRMTRDTFAFCTRYMPHANVISLGGYHIREAGANREQDLGFTLSNGIAYLQLGVDAGLDIDSFAPRMTFNAFGGSIEFFKEIALHRAARRMWARIIKDRFGAKNDRSCVLREPQAAHMGGWTCTRQRPLNNLIRAVVGGMEGALSGGPPNCEPPFDEPLGLGWSLEAMQLAEDAARILQYEAKVTDVIDPLGGSYYVESLTDELEAAGWAIIEKLDGMGGSVGAIEAGFMQREIAKSAYERQRLLESGERVVVGVNKFIGENELDVRTTRLVPNPYDATKREEAEKRQIARLVQVRRERDNRAVKQKLQDLKAAAKKEEVNLIPPIIECVREYASEGEVFDVLREVFGQYQPAPL